MVLHDKTGRVIVTRHRIRRYNRLARGLGDYRWAASARCWRRRWGAAAAVRTLNRHGDARIGDGKTGGPLGPFACSTTSPNATADVRLVFGVAVMVSSCVSPRPPLKLKLDGWTSIVNPGVIAVPVAVQLVPDVSVLRTVRVHVQSGVHSILRSDGMFKVLGSPPVFGFASRKCCVVSSITRPARAALLSSILPVPRRLHPMGGSILLGATIERGHHQGRFYLLDGPICVNRSHQCSRAGIMRGGHRCAADSPVCSKVDGERGIDEYARSGDVRLLDVLERRRVRTTQAEIRQNIALSRGS